jgi:hypothetical protein
MGTLNKEYKRNCPKCGKELFYEILSSYRYANKINSKCNSCANRIISTNRIRPKKFGFLSRTHSDVTKQKISDSQIGNKNHMYGTKHSNETNIKNSNSQKERYLNSEVRKKTSESTKLALHKPDIRKRHINAMSETKYLSRKTDKGQLELIEKWNRLGFNLEPNFQIKTDSDLFYIDGYDKKKNVVLEYDTKYHKRLSQKQKDLVRQEKIIELLTPSKFWRYDSETKQFKDILKT